MTKLFSFTKRFSSPSPPAPNLLKTSLRRLPRRPLYLFRLIFLLFLSLVKLYFLFGQRYLIFLLPLLHRFRLPEKEQKYAMTQL